MRVVTHYHATAWNFLGFFPRRLGIGDFLEGRAGPAQRALVWFPNTEGHARDTLQLHSFLGGEFIGGVAKDDERAAGDGFGAACEQVGVGAFHGGAGADGVVDDGDGPAAEAFALRGGHEVFDGEKAGGGGWLDAVGVETLNAQISADHLRQHCAAGHRANYGVDPMRAQFAGEFADEGLQTFPVGEESVEVEPPFTVVAGLHPEVPATAGEKREEGGLHQLPAGTKFTAKAAYTSAGWPLTVGGLNCQ